MKLKSCHITGFGIYENKDITFDDLYQVIGPNGYGKTTLVDFIRSMLYEMNKELKLRYAPLNTNDFGGSLTLEFEGKEYRVEKDLDKKSPKKDVERIYINNSLTDLKSLGLSLFKIDEESFLKTIFITNNDLTISSTSSINLKLNSLVNKTEEDFDLDLVIKNLNEENKKYGTTARVSSIYLKAKEELKLKNEEFERLQSLNDSLDPLYLELNEKEKELDKIDKDIKEKEKINEKVHKFNTYQNYLSTIEKYEEDKNNINQSYKKLLNEEEIEKISLKLDNYKELKNKNNKFINDIEFNKLESMFSNKNLNDDSFKEIDSKIKELEIIKDKFNNYDQKLISEEDIKRFDGYDVLNDIIDAKNHLNNYNELNDKIIASKEIKQEKNFNYSYIFSLLGAILLVLGITFVALSKMALGISLLSIGAIFIIIFVLFLFKPKDSKQNNNDSLMYEYRKEEKILTDILARYRYNDLSYEAKLNHLEHDYNIYLENKNYNEKINESNNEYENKINALKKDIESFLNTYLDNYDTYSEALRIVNNKFDRYISLKKDKSDLEKINENNNLKINSIIMELDPFLKEFNLNLDNANSYLINMRTDLKRLNDINKNILEFKEKANSYLKENDLDLSYNYELIDLKDLENNKNIINKECIELKRSITDYEMELEKLPYLKSECYALNDKLKEYKHKYEIINNTISELEKASNTLKEKYIEPIKTSFVKYAKILNSIFKENVTFDGDFNLKLVRNGKLVDDYHLSQGEKTIAMLCYRMALIDNMYDNKPFIILDDPFVNLDEANLDEALNLIKLLSKNTQILYFSCVKNRKI